MEKQKRDRSVLKNQHRDILAKKKKKSQTEKQKRDKSVLIGTIGA